MRRVPGGSPGAAGVLHGKIDILRAELVNRLRKKHEGGGEIISGDDVQRLTDILAGKAAGTEDEG